MPMPPTAGFQAKPGHTLAGMRLAGNRRSIAPSTTYSRSVSRSWLCADGTTHLDVGSALLCDPRTNVSIQSPYPPLARAGPLREVLAAHQRIVVCGRYRLGIVRSWLKTPHEVRLVGCIPVLWKAGSPSTSGPLHRRSNHLGSSTIGRRERQASPSLPQGSRRRSAAPAARFQQSQELGLTWS